MMPAPLINREHPAACRDLVPAHLRTTSVPVFYATNRLSDSTDQSAPSYCSTRCDLTRLGAAVVRIGPEDWDWQRLSDETLAGEQPRMTVTSVEEFGPLATLPAPDAPNPASSSDHFASAINSALAASTQKDVFIYIPGINIGFDMILQRTAEFSHHLGRQGAFIAYAWPCHAHPFSYDTDHRCANESIPQFAEFLTFLHDHTDARRIHLLTSSAGAPVVSGVLTTLHDSPSHHATSIGQVIYAAPDQDIAAFRALIASGHADACDHITVYASSSDLGLILSSVFGSGKQTIGRLPADLTDADAALLRDHADRVTIVDVTGAVDHAGRGDLWAHRYWYANPWVSSDILTVLRTAQPPAARNLIPTHGHALWSFPDDYPQRISGDGPRRASPFVSSSP